MIYSTFPYYYFLATSKLKFTEFRANYGIQSNVLQLLHK